MATKKEKTKKQKGKGDIFDFMKAASRQGSTMGMDFLEELNKKGVKAEELHNLLIGWGYECDPGDVTKLLNIFKTRPIVQQFFTGMSRAY